MRLTSYTGIVAASVAAAAMVACGGGQNEADSPEQAKWRSARPDRANLEVQDPVENAPEALISPEPSATAAATGAPSAAPGATSSAAGSSAPAAPASKRGVISGVDKQGSGRVAVGGSGSPGLVRGKADEADQQLALADAAYARNDFDAALSYYRQARRLIPNEPAPVVGIVMTRLEKEQIPTEYAGAKQDKRLKDLFRLLDKAKSLDADYGPMHLQYGRLLLIQGDAKAAGVSLARAVQLLPNDAEAHSAFAVSKLAEGDVAGALAGFKRAAELQPNNAARLTNLGTAYMMHGEAQLAISAYRRAVSLAPTDARARGDLGTALLATNNVKGALPHLIEAQRLAPGKATFMSNLGYAYQQQGDLPAAVSWYEKAIAADPQLGSAWINLGIARADQGDFDGAETAIKKALSIDPSDPRAQANLKELKQARTKAGK